jgi:long-chain acyl-CoA synthetase
MVVALGCGDPDLKNEREDSFGMSTVAKQRTSDGGTVASLVVEAARHHGNAVRHGSTTVAYRELVDIARAISKGLIALGIEPGDRVGILANTRPEWTFADLGILLGGMVTVPVYQTNSPEECQYVLEHSGAKAVFVEDAEQLDKIDQIKGECPELEHVIAFKDARGEAMSLDDLRTRGGKEGDDELERRIAAVTPDDLATIVYTSGTTGPPKGCMLTHGNIASDLEMVAKRIESGPGDVYYVFLPLAHVLTRIVQFVALNAGAELAYWQGDPKKIVNEIAEIRPTHLPSVPRIFEKIHTAATAKANAAGGAKAKMFHWAVGVGEKVRDREREGKSVDPLLKAQHTIADKLVLSKVRSLFGDRIKLCLTGAAPIEPEIIEFFHAAGVYVLEGYGMTETSAVATVNTLEENKPGTVGKPVPGCEIKIAEDGEVLMRGPNIFKGYYRNEEATRSDLRDGWLHSGDLGEIDSEGYLKITGRKKDLIITSSGKNITPSQIENAIRQSRWISQAVVYGDRKPYLTALITLDPDEAPALAEHVGASDKDPAALARNEAVRSEIQKAIDEANKRFARIEQVKKFDILARDFSPEEDELTPTLKLKRNVVYDRYDDEFQALYDKS